MPQTKADFAWDLELLSLWVSHKLICDLTLMKRWCESVLASVPWEQGWNSTLEKSQEEISWCPTDRECFFAIEPCPTTEAPILVSMREQWRSRSPFPSNFPFHTFHSAHQVAGHQDCVVRFGSDLRFIPRPPSPNSHVHVLICILQAQKNCFPSRLTLPCRSLSSERAKNSWAS